MDLSQVKELRRSLTLHFAIIAWLTAMLVATGTGSIFLPLLIICVSLAAYIFVDTLEWFELGRIGSYLGMSTATAIAVASYIYSAFYAESESGQLMAVAGLLVYPEAVLFLQKKNIRIYEQLAVFLLLEMIVAALVNDNILFGLLLAPIMLLWVSSLFLFSRYATLVQMDPSIETPLPKLAEVLFKRVVRTVLGNGDQKKVLSTRWHPPKDMAKRRPLRRLLQTFPIGIGALVFAGLFFYLLPRTQPAFFASDLGNARAVGLPNRLTFGGIGKILQNRSPVMRISLTHNGSNQPYRLEYPPYLRAAVFDHYGPDPRRRSSSRGEWRLVGSKRTTKMPSIAQARPLREFDRDLVNIEFDIRRTTAPSMYTLPPSYAVRRKQPVPTVYIPSHLAIAKLDEENIPPGKSIVYEIGSAAFSEGRQSPVYPAYIDRSLDNLTRGFSSFERINQYRLNLLREAKVDETDSFRAARTFEEHFINSGEFSYSLDIRPPSDPDWDPIEDFLINQRSGHCQYYASAMVALLRQTGIRSRIVIGYRPNEYNDLGKYFLARQSDAHAWAEGLFAREQLVGTEYEKWLTDASYFWVRFDATTPVEGDTGIIEQQGQALDFAEKLWKDYVVEGQKLAGENSLYAPVSQNSENAYDDLVAQLKSFGESVRTGSFWRGESGFILPILTTLVAVLVVAVGIWQLIVWLPRIFPRLAFRLGFAKSVGSFREQFFARCIRTIEKLGIRREQSDTPLEFTEGAGDILRSKGLAADDSLGFLTRLYYQLRFGDDEDSPGGERPRSDSPERNRIDAELRKVEEAVRDARR